MIPVVPPIAVSRPLLFGLTAVGAVVAVLAPQPTSSFAAGFGVGAGFVFVLSFLSSRRSAPPVAEETDDRERSAR
jgi:hypothetical protein